MPADVYGVNISFLSGDISLTFNIYVFSFSSRHGELLRREENTLQHGSFHIPDF